MAVVAADLLLLLYEDGKKDKPLSPMITNPLDPSGPLIGRDLGLNDWDVISEWASMIFLQANKRKRQKSGANNTTRAYVCTDVNCKSEVKVGISGIIQCCSSFDSLFSKFYIATTLCFRS